MVVQLAILQDNVRHAYTARQTDLLIIIGYTPLIFVILSREWCHKMSQPGPYEAIEGKAVDSHDERVPIAPDEHQFFDPKYTVHTVQVRYTDRLTLQHVLP